MGKYIVYILIAFNCLTSLLSSSTTASTVDISIGGSVWYSWWEPPWMDGKKYLPPYSQTDYAYSMPYKIANFSTNSGFLYGPILSIRFLDKVTISTAFMYGNFTAISNGPGYTSNEGLYGKYRKEIEKFDSDTIISYAFYPMFSIFIGFKAQGYQYDEKLSFTVVSALTHPFYGKGKARLRNYGPGVGISLTIPLFKSLFILYKISGSILLGSEFYDITYLFSDNLVFPNAFDDSKFYSLGGNSFLAIAYYIEQAGLSLSLGFRYQVLYYQHSRTPKEHYGYNGKYDHFYGIQFAAVYSFYIGKKNKK